MKYVFLALWCMMTVFSCQMPEDSSSLVSLTFVPPQYISGAMVSPQEAKLEFSRTAYSAADDLFISGNHRITEIVSHGETLSISLDSPIPSGEKRILQGTFRDAFRNTLHLSVTLYGFNEYPAVLSLNEFVTRGSDNHPDRVELLVTQSGCTGGITVYDGIRGDYRQKKILPALAVTAGEYLIIHFRPGDGTCKDETERKDSAQCAGTHDEAWDLFIQGGIGLSGNNGVITLYESPAGPISEGVFYSDRTSSSDDRYRGFGSTRMLMQVEYLCRTGVWDGCPDTVSPEDGISSAYSTATRSMSRIPGSYTGSQDDWITVPTRGSTFGYENTVEQHVP